MTALNLRAPDEVMRLERMGSMHATRLSFMPTLVRRMERERWQFSVHQFDLDADGYGVAVLCANTPAHTYSLVVFSQALDPEQRTDRVIAEAWDATFNLYDGVPTRRDIERLARNTPLQEAGRFLPTELVLARANKSVRLFTHVVERLSRGQQPDIEQIAAVGYLMRTTAVYGSGKFGCADRGLVADREELRGAFQVEMLTVYLIRWFTLLLVEHVSRNLGGDNASSLDPAIGRFLGIGNATGLGMAPFVARHPTLVHQWVLARETALARIRAVAAADERRRAQLVDLVKRFQQHSLDWTTSDPVQLDRLQKLADESHQMLSVLSRLDLHKQPWDWFYQYAHENFSLEAQELVVSLLIETHGDLVDDLTESMYHGERVTIQPAMPVGRLKQLIQKHFEWALNIDFSTAEANRRFWYYSEDKIEPRLGDRFVDAGAEIEMPLAIGRDVSQLAKALGSFENDDPVAEVMSLYPELRRIVQRVQSAESFPYAEVHDNLIDESMRPIDLLRFKLSFFGATRFDPKSDLWTRITMFQGAPLPEDLERQKPIDWVFPVRPEIDS
jgi:hypothetical protein